MPLALAPKQTQAKAGALKANSAELLVHGVIGLDEGVTSADVVLALAEIGADTPLHLRINSPGGVAFDGIAIYNALINHAGGVTASIDGMAASAASVIAMAASHITMQRGSMFVIHNAHSFTIGDHHAHDLTAETLRKISFDMAAIYTDRTGLDAQEIRFMMDRETTLTAQEAVDKGFADALANGKGLQNRNSSAMSKFQQQLKRNSVAI